MVERVGVEQDMRSSAELVLNDSFYVSTTAPMCPKHVHNSSDKHRFSFYLSFGVKYEPEHIFKKFPLIELPRCIFVSTCCMCICLSIYRFDRAL